MKVKQIQSISILNGSTKLVEIFCILDEFCKYFTPELKKHTLEVPGKCHRPGRMSDSEIMTISAIFNTRHYRDLKSFYLCHVLLAHA